jgi:hypothetical protein
MITVTLKQILEARNTLAEMTKMKMPLKAAYTIAKIIRKSNDELEEFAKIRDSIMKSVDEDKREVQLLEALETKVELPVNKLTLDQLGNLEISPQLLYGIDPFLDSNDK